MTAAEIAARLGAARRCGAWWRCRCPAHGSNGATLALRDGDRGGLCIKCFAGCTRDQVIAELRRLGLVNDSAEAAPKPPDRTEIERRRAAEQREWRRRVREACDFWRRETLPAAGTIVERYWLSRGLALPIPPSCRASRSWLKHPEGGHWPAMVALVEHVEHGAVAVHRTFLARDGSGKADREPPRLSLGAVGGGAVRLAPAGDVLLTGEGIETVAAAMAATGLPGWAALSTSGLRSLVLPPLPLAATVIITADHDANGAGEQAARAAAERWAREGRKVRIALPPQPGTDFNDMLRGHDG